MIERGEGVWLYDAEGNAYIDGNSSIWTNIHGHCHPKINAAVAEQLGKIAHSSFLGFGHALAGQLAEKLCGHFAGTDLQRVFYSDDGSTAVECAMKMALQYHMQNEASGGMVDGVAQRVEFVAFSNAYHGDTLGAASLGGVEAFFSRFRGLGAKVHFVKNMQELRAMEDTNKLAGVVIEPLVQGVNEIHVWPEGMLRELRAWTQEQGVFLILDEVMTGFGRTGTMFACQQEEVVPDFLCLAKGLTGGYLPMAATLVRERVYEGFLGSAERAFYYGHSYTANPLGCAAALASLELFDEEQTLVGVKEKAVCMAYFLTALASECALIHEVRRCGMVAGVELRAPNGEKFPRERRVGEAVCMAARKYGLLTRPILDTIVFMPPLSITRDELGTAVNALKMAIQEVMTEAER